MAEIKGYPTQSGYMGYISWLNEYRLFATETDYIEFIRELNDVA